MSANAAVPQAVLEDFLGRVSADGPVTVDLTGLVIEVSDPPLTIPSGGSGIRITGRWGMSLPDAVSPELAGTALSYRLPDIKTGPSQASIGFAGENLRIRTGPGGSIGVTPDGVSPLGDGGSIAEVRPQAPGTDITAAS